MAVVCLLVLLGGALVSSMPIYSMPDALVEARESIVIPLNLTHPDVGSNPLFTSVIRSLNSSCQQDVMLLNATLDVYMRIFSSLLPHSAHSAHSAPLLKQVGSSEVEKVKNVIKKIRKHMSKRQSELRHLHPNKDDLLSKINAIKVDEPLVQRKALAELWAVDSAISGFLHFRDNGYAR